MTPRDRVRRAIRFGSPDRPPILFFNRDQECSDIVLFDAVRHFMGEKKDHSEWGFEWERRDDTMGRPKQVLIDSWNVLGHFQAPDAYDDTRFEGWDALRERCGSERYALASLVLSGFTVMSALRGFDAACQDLYMFPEQTERLADLVFDFERGIIDRAAEEGFDGVAFYDDWGTQDSLLISPELWRTWFRPRYEREFEYAHTHGLDVYFHSCGMIAEIIPDLIEIGVDMLNLSQPNLYDIEALGARYRGQVCFVCPVSYQTTSISGTRHDIFREAERLVANLACPEGGFIGYVEEYHSIGMSEDNYQACIDAFRTVRPAALAAKG